MTGFSQSFAIFEKLRAKRHVARNLVKDFITSGGSVFASDLETFHKRITGEKHGFALVKSSPEGVRPRGLHFFYLNDPILVRVKTSGTDRRPRPHLTISLCEDLSWPGEAAKLNKDGDVVPRVGPVNAAAVANHWRSLLRIGSTLAEISASDDAWANSCHFDFPPGFDGSAASRLAARSI